MTDAPRPVRHDRRADRCVGNYSAKTEGGVRTNRRDQIRTDMQGLENS